MKAPPPYLLCLSLIAGEALLGLEVLYIGGVAGWRVGNRGEIEYQDVCYCCQ